jgi:hypothetical protein
MDKRIDKKDIENLTLVEKELFLKGYCAFKESKYIENNQAEVMLKILSDDIELRSLVRLLNGSPMTGAETVAFFNLMGITTNTGEKWKVNNFRRHEKEVLKKVKVELKNCNK